jgi:glycosyltransferase involved in cell wall biosynthesis
VKLVASLVCREELGRYLEPCVRSLQEFCDEIRVLDDASCDGSFEWLAEQDRVQVLQLPSEQFFIHEGRTRQALIDWTLISKPDAVLSIDCDEFVSDGKLLRERLDAEPQVPVWSLAISEVWSANQDALWIREDGGWRTHPLSVLWKVIPHHPYTMMDRKLACRRVPQAVLSRQAKPSGVELLHYGWTDPETRKARYDRYVQHDGGKFHASTHLRSIMAPESTMRFRERTWPEGVVFDQLKERFTEVTV